jgi:hypothetical protein
LDGNFKKLSVKEVKRRIQALAYDGSKKEMVGSHSISSSSNEGKFFGGNDILQINKEESVRHTIFFFGRNA